MNAAHETPLALRVEGDAQRQKLLPPHGTLVIGSAEDKAGLVVAGQGVADAHCAIGSIKGGGWAIKDLGSRYGTIVNGEPVESTRLKAGDEILLGSRRLVVVPGNSSGVAPRNGGSKKKAPTGTQRKESPRIGGYRIERPLGRGGMGQVFLAVQESLNRPVALKILSQRLAADRDFVQRFQKEARSAAALSHPNVVVVYDVGDEDGYHFLSMEFMAGGSVEGRIAAKGPLPWRQALDVVLDAARGLTFAEERGIVHRDIKPDNLMIAGNGTVKIADLGLATTSEADAKEEKIYGTPHFIAPEQARGEAPDHRSDLYSLGASAFRILTGRTPFEGDSSKEILLGHFHQEPPKPSSLVPDLPPGIDQVVLRLLAKEPAQRFGSAEELVADLERLRLEADHGSLAAAPRRSRLPLVVGSLLVLILAATAAIFFLRQSQEQPTSPGRVAAPRNPPASEEAFLATKEPEQPPKLDEDQGLKLLELEAELALGRISDSVKGQERLKLLAEINENFAGTPAAAKARAEHSRLSRALASPTSTKAVEGQESEVAERKLLEALSWPLPEGELPRPVDLLEDLAGPTVAAQASALAPEKLDAVRESIVAECARRLAARIEGLAEPTRRGDFDAVRQGLFEVRDLLPADRLAQLEQVEPLKALGTRIDERLAGLDAERAAWLHARLVADRSTLARSLGATSGAHGLLSGIDLDGVQLRLDAARQESSSPEMLAWIDDLVRDVEAARLPLRTLVDEFQRGNWRRSRVNDPRGGRSTARSTVGATEEGLLLEVDGEGELVPWSAFGEDPPSLDKLLHERLERDYTGEELAGIVALLRLVDAGHVASIVGPYLGAGASERLKAADEERLLSAFDLASDWSVDTASEEAVDRERQAARLLLATLRAHQEQAWSDCATFLERLLDEFGSTWTVLLLFDGSDWIERPGNQE